MPISKQSRKDRVKDFRTALAAAGMSQADWAKANAISAAYLSNILAGRVPSEPMWERIGAFTQDQLRTLQAPKAATV